MPPRRLPLLLALWCVLAVLPGAVAAAAFDVDTTTGIQGPVAGVWIVGYLAQFGVFLAVSRLTTQVNTIGWVIASGTPFVSDFGAPASIIGPIAAALLCVGFACWLYWSATRQAKVLEHGVAAEGEVLKVKSPIMNSIINDVYIRRTLLLRIRRSDGVAPYEAKWAGTFMLGAIPDPGDRLTLRVDPRDPRHFEVVDHRASSAGAAPARSGSRRGGGAVSDDIANQLQHLTALHHAGDLTDAEFSAAKAHLLGGR